MRNANWLIAKKFTMSIVACDAKWFRQDIKKPCHVKAIPNALEVQSLVKYLTFVMTKYELKCLNAIPLGQYF